jgi:hypothetical protein
MWNPFKKNSTTNTNSDDSSSGNSEAEVKAPKMGMLQAMAMKKMAKMSPQERQKMMQEAMRPENRDKIMTMMNAMKASGQVTDEQIAQAKKMFGM